jgi:nicotinamidase-related amidase
VPVIFANDNFGRWRSELDEVTRHVLHDGVRGQPVAERLRPGPDDYVVLKPKHTAFFATPLDTLLKHLGTERLVLTGMSTEMCVLFTAMDAHVRDLHLHVPADCVASAHPRRNAAGPALPGGGAGRGRAGLAGDGFRGAGAGGVEGPGGPGRGAARSPSLLIRCPTSP